MKLLRALKDVFISSLPLLAVIAIVFFISPMPAGGIIKVVIGYVLVVVGQAFFLIGLDNSIIPIGKFVGSSLIKLKKAVYIILFGLIFGMVATVAEPALAVLAGQVNSINPEINRTLFVWLLGTGVGVAVGFAMFRVLKNLNLKYVFLFFYAAVFILVFFAPSQFRALAFDASGATTGDVSVPFILALGMGVSTTMSKSKTNDDSFGIIGLASIGPIIAVFIYGMVLGNAETLLPYSAGQEETLGAILSSNLGGVALAILPIIAVFILFQFFFIKLPKKQIVKILISSVVVFAGLYVFLVGIDFGFAYAGKYIGEVFADPARPQWFRWLLLGVGFVLGFAITMTEPAVTVLGEQVEGITNGHIKKNLLKTTLAIGIGFAGLISILKILTDINFLWLLIPLYVISLVMLLFTPKLFVGLAFDSGGVSGGAITSAFLTPLTLGLSQMLGQEILTSGLGMIAFISITPMISVQALGIIYSFKLKKLARVQQATDIDELMQLTADDEEPAANAEPMQPQQSPAADANAAPQTSETPVVVDAPKAEPAVQVSASAEQALLAANKASAAQPQDADTLGVEAKPDAAVKPKDEKIITTDEEKSNG